MKELKELGREAEMMKERPLKLSGVADVEKKWDTLRDKSKAFEGQRDRWKFCASEVLYPDSLFFLGLNPSEPKEHLHTCFDLNGLIKYGRIFTPLRKIAARLDWTYSYFDLFCFRRTEAVDLQDFLTKLLETEEGRDAVAAMIELARQAITTTRPKAIYICNARVRDILLGTGSLAKSLHQAGLASGFFLESSTLQEFPSAETGGKKLYSTVTMLDGQPIPVILGIQLSGKFLSKEIREKVSNCIVKTLKEQARLNPE